METVEEQKTLEETIKTKVEVAMITGLAIASFSDDHDKSIEKIKATAEKVSKDIINEFESRGYKN